MPWEKKRMHASLFFSVLEGSGQLSCTCKRLLYWWRKMHISNCKLGWLPKGIVQFLGRATECYLYLQKSWAKQPIDGKNCANPAGSGCRQDCAILEPSRLPERIVKFLEGRLVSLQKCAIFKGKLLSVQLDQVRVNSLWGEWIKMWPTSYLWQERHWSLRIWRSKASCCEGWKGGSKTG